MKLTKHVGFDIKSNARIALIMTRLPDTEDCLVIDSDRLPDNLKTDFMHVLGSQEGQSAVNLADVLTRRLYSDTGKSLLQSLHDFGFIRKSPIDDIEMNPMASMKLPLRYVLTESGILQKNIDVGDTSKFNPHHFNSKAANVGEALGTARNLLYEADLLEKEALQKREKAYNFAPSLRPLDKIDQEVSPE